MDWIEDVRILEKLTFDCHSREGGGPGNIRKKLDSRLRGNVVRCKTKSKTVNIVESRKNAKTIR